MKDQKECIPQHKPKRSFKDYSKKLLYPNSRKRNRLKKLAEKIKYRFLITLFTRSGKKEKRRGKKYIKEHEFFKMLHVEKTDKRTSFNKYDFDIRKN